ncbi:CLUMA_CG010413, isoform A [Clunio marinus]|uniref:CLUMA_CG010413, isoform A n=1 Tax=Clunio marinus TaxID=568069 RepID=A0A1J1IDF0_9DIPT|nr:CLUMA_CG010413, isoform A [Clunio marinus]
METSAAKCLKLTGACSLILSQLTLMKLSRSLDERKIVCRVSVEGRKEIKQEKQIVLRLKRDRGKKEEELKGDQHL